MNTINVDGQEFNENEIRQLIQMSRELLQANDDMRANVIAMSAKLENEEKKVVKLTQQLYFISQTFTNNTFEA